MPRRKTPPPPPLPHYSALSGDDVLAWLTLLRASLSAQRSLRTTRQKIIFFANHIQDHALSWLIQQLDTNLTAVLGGQAARAKSKEYALVGWMYDVRRKESWTFLLGKKFVTETLIDWNTFLGKFEEVMRYWGKELVVLPREVGVIEGEAPEAIDWTGERREERVTQVQVVVQEDVNGNKENRPIRAMPRRKAKERQGPERGGAREWTGGWVGSEADAMAWHRLHYGKR